MTRGTTNYFDAMRSRPHRAQIEMSWIESVITNPVRTETQDDGRIRKWAKIPQADGRYLRVILLPDGETIQNVFFDRDYRP